MKQRQEMENNKNHHNNSNKEEHNPYLGVAIHSQVRKIRQEMEKIKQPSLDQPEIRPVLHEITGHRQILQQRSRSPLGLAERPILVGNS
ncbi:hypothetical protein RHGRI_026628 [Rhododendron griersonianum]|uniref:Uncharacterized protein n=1 Tax=Rhododendron griersonianum TaxID=479676 RepID=A0AAV6IX14_9ERIC|nr:hypothetical protein RHGRI_026628 [Rhododendron griersonianum]